MGNQGGHNLTTRVSKGTELSLNDERKKQSYKAKIRLECNLSLEGQEHFYCHESVERLGLPSEVEYDPPVNSQQENKTPAQALKPAPGWQAHFPSLK